MNRIVFDRLNFRKKNVPTRVYKYILFLHLYQQFEPR